MTGHEMSDAAKWKVGTRFLNNPTGEEIWLHIDARSTLMNHRFICILGNSFPADDGLMGGGESIEHRDPLRCFDSHIFHNLMIKKCEFKEKG